MNKLSEFKIYKENMDMQYENQVKSSEDKINSLNATIEEKELQVRLYSAVKIFYILDWPVWCILKIAKLQETINELNGEFQNKLDVEIKSELSQFKMLQEQKEEMAAKSYESQIEQLKLDIKMLKVR